MNLREKQQWRAYAACRGMDTNIFFETTSLEEAKQTCRRCPVRSACADHAIHEYEEAGIWGATHPEERRQNRQAQGAAPGRAIDLTFPRFRREEVNQILTEGRAAGGAFAQIAEHLNAVGIPTSVGKPWNAHSLRAHAARTAKQEGAAA